MKSEIGRGLTLKCGRYGFEFWLLQSVFFVFTSDYVRSEGSVDAGRI